MMARALLVAYCVGAGCALFLLVYNRLVLRIQNVRARLAAILLALGLLPAAAWYARLAARSPGWLALPTAVWALVLVDEADRLRVRRRCRASGPVDADAARVRLARPLTTHDLAVCRYVVRSDRWRGAPLRIAHVSDLHINERMPPEYLRDVVARVAETDPDLVVISGDFVLRKTSIDLIAPALKGLTARHGVYATLGNHDIRAGRPEVVRAAAGAGIRVLENEWARVEGPGGTVFAVVGCQLPWHRSGWPPAGWATAGLPSLCLSHTPDNIYALARFDPVAVFAGHYHGGQASIPGLGPPVIPSRYGRRFDRGHFCVDGAHLFVSAGIGTTFPRFRVYCRPEIVQVELFGIDGRPAS